MLWLQLMLNLTGTAERQGQSRVQGELNDRQWEIQVHVAD